MSRDEAGAVARLGVADSIAWQAEHCRRNDAPVTARVLTAMLAVMREDTACGRRMAGWTGSVMGDAMPLRIAGGMHWLHLSGADVRLAPVYAGAVVEQAAVDGVVLAVARDHDAALLPWFDGPPQTNEAGRSAAIMAGLAWLSGRVGSRFELNEMGCSAGANTMIERYGYDLGGVRFGPAGSPLLIQPEWRGGPPPDAPVEIVAIEGCDQAPIDLADAAAALRLRSYVWAENAARLERLDRVIALAREKTPRLTRADAADWVEAMLAREQAAGVARVLYHSIVWQYVSPKGRARISDAMATAGARATAERPLAWLALETNRETFQHELRVRFWPGGGERVRLAAAHAHGAWVEWFDEGG